MTINGFSQVLDINSPIGIFDSGVGGLTVARELRRLAPHESLIYLADAARLPYGTKSSQTVTRYALQAARYLQTHNVKMLVIACNTASAHGVVAVRKAVAPIPVLGVVEAGASAAAAITATGGVVVAATEGTCETGIFPKLIATAHPGSKITQVPCPLFVALAEEGLGDSPIADAMARDYLVAHFSAQSGNDTLLLGCTHFPLLAASLRRIIGPAAQMVDCAEAVAKDVVAALNERGLSAQSTNTAQIAFYATDAQSRLSKLAGKLMPDLGAAPPVTLIDL